MAFLQKAKSILTGANLATHNVGNSQEFMNVVGTFGNRRCV
jgi:hypothetical protein